MDSDGNSDDEFQDFCRNANKNKDKSKITPQTSSQNIKGKQPTTHLKKKRRIKLSILKEKAKQNYFNALRDLQSQYEDCDSDDIEEMTMNLRNDYDNLKSFLDDEHATNEKNIEKQRIDESAKRKVKKRLSYPETADLSQSNSPELNMSLFSTACYNQPQGTAKKNEFIRSPINRRPESELMNTPLRRPIEDLTPLKGAKKSFRSKLQTFRTPIRIPSKLKTVCEMDENSSLTSPPPGHISNQRPVTITGAPKKQFALNKQRPISNNTQNDQSFRDPAISPKKLPMKGSHLQPEPVPSVSGVANPQKNDPRKNTFTGLSIKPKFKPITEHNIGMYKTRAHNEYTKKVTHAKRTIPVAQRTAVIDKLKYQLDKKLKRIDKLPQLQKELDLKYAEDMRKVTEQLHDWTDGRNSELNSLKRNYELRTEQLVKDFEVAELEEMPKARPKMQLKRPKYNLSKFRERAITDFKRKSDYAKKNIPISNRHAYICNLKKELDKQLEHIDNIPELAKNLESKYIEAVNNTANQFSNNEELLQEQLEFLKEEYDAKIGNLDEDSIMPMSMPTNEPIKNPVVMNKTYDTKKVSDKIGPVLEVNVLPKPCVDIITQKDQILADLEMARKSNKTKKQVLNAASKRNQLQNVPVRSIQETVREDKFLAKKQLMEAARLRAKKIKLKQLKKGQSSEVLVPQLPQVVTVNPLRKEGAEDIFRMMLLEHEAVDMSKPPKDVVELLTKIDVPKLDVVGNAFELDDNEIVPILIPTRDLNQLNDAQEEEIAFTLNMKQHPIPAAGLAAQILKEKKPLKIKLNKNPDYEPIEVSVYLNSYKYENMFQVRGSTFPKWFPGFYACGPQENAPQIILRESPSEILTAAWIGMKPKRIY